MTQIPTQRADYSRIDPETGEMIMNELGQEIPDPVAMAPPLGFTKPLSMFDQMRAQIRAEHTRLRQLELEELAETPDQANDFDIDEDIENQPSLYEEKFDPVDYEVRQRLRNKEFRDEVEKREKALNPQPELLDGKFDNDVARKGSDTPSDRGSDRNKKSSSREVKTSGVQGSLSKGSAGSALDDGED